MAIRQISSLHKAILSLGFFCCISSVAAHDIGNLNDASLDRTNDIVVTSVERVQQLLANIFQYSPSPAIWPHPEILKIRDELLHMQEETVMALEYLVDNGINIQNPHVLRSDPMAGRTVSASQAIDVAMNLLNHAASLASQDDFIKEIYNSGLSAYMYNLLGAHKDRMELYKELMQKTD